MLPYREGGGLLVVEWGADRSAGSVTTQRKAFKYVTAYEPYRCTWYLKQVMASLSYIKIYLFLNTYSIEIKVSEFGFNF
jgi:hypothetical protein